MELQIWVCCAQASQPFPSPAHRLPILLPPPLDGQNAVQISTVMWRKGDLGAAFQSHTVSKWQSWGLNPNPSDPSHGHQSMSNGTLPGCSWLSCGWGIPLPLLTLSCLKCSEETLALQWPGMAVRMQILGSSAPQTVISAMGFRKYEF